MFFIKKFIVLLFLFLFISVFGFCVVDLSDLYYGLSFPSSIPDSTIIYTDDDFRVSDIDYFIILEMEDEYLSPTFPRFHIAVVSSPVDLQIGQWNEINFSDTVSFKYYIPVNFDDDGNLNTSVDPYAEYFYSPQYMEISDNWFPYASKAINTTSFGITQASAGIKIKNIYANYDIDLFDYGNNLIKENTSFPDFSSWIFMGSPFHAYESYEGSVPTNLSIDYSEIADDVADDGFISDVGFYYNNIIDVTSLEINGRVWWASSDYMGYTSSMNYGSFTENLNEYTNVTGFVTFDLPYSLFGSGNNYIDIFYEYMEDDLCKSGQVSQELYIGNGEILGSSGLPDNISDIIAGVYDPQNSVYENPTTAEEKSTNLLQKILNAINAPFLMFEEIFTSIFDTVSGFFAFFGHVFSFLPPQILMIVMFGLSLTLVLRILGR